MNAYRDKHLDDRGARELDQIIQISESDTDRALKMLDSLILRYPHSPQLLVSRSILVPVKHTHHLVPLYEKAVQLDPGFYDTYRRSSNCVMICAFPWNSELPGQRQEYFLHTMQLQAMLLQQDWVSAVTYLDQNPGLLVQDWRRIFAEAVAIRERGLRCMDQSRYTVEERSGFADELRSYQTADDSMKKLLMLVQWMRVIAMRSHNAPR